MNSNEIIRTSFEIRSRRGDGTENVQYSGESDCRRAEVKAAEDSRTPRRWREELHATRSVSLFLVVLFISAACFGSEQPVPRDKGKEAPEHQRGWIGGEYKLARRHWSWHDTTEAVYAFPAALTNTQKGVLVTGLSTNTPAYLAGLREADLILEVDHEKIASLAAFREKIDRAKPGSTLTLHAYRDGEVQDCNVTAGRETFRNGGNFAVGLFYDLPSFKFNPSFSLIALGLYCGGDKRTELGSVEEIFRRENLKDHHPSETCWRAWAGPLFVTRTREIRSQEIVNP